MKLQFGFNGHLEKDNELQKNAEEKLQASPKPFEIRCLNHELNFTNEKSRAYVPFFYIDVMRCGDFYFMEEVWQQKDLLDFGDFADDSKPEVEIYYPYHDPAFVRLQWWNDTYSGIVDVRAVEKPGWVKLTASFSDKEFETYKGPDEESEQHTKRKNFMELNVLDYNAICHAVRRLKDKPEVLPTADWNRLDLIRTRIRAQNSW